MPKGHVQVVIYLPSLEEREKVKQVAKEMGVSVSELVRAFFRSITEGKEVVRPDAKNIIINANINIMKQELINVQQTLITNIKLQLTNVLNIIQQGIKANQDYEKHNALIYARDEINKLLSSLR